MPDLVYNVKFNIDQPSPQQLPGGAGGRPSGPPAGQQSQIDNLTKSTQRYTQILERYNNLARTNGKLTTQQRLAYTKASRTVENYRADLLLASEAVENLSTQQIQSLNKAVSGANRSLGSASGHLQGMGNSMSGVNKIGNNSNQILLSFGDALQDSAQFSQGFAAGMRAVGNNLTFAAEQFGYAMARAGGFRNALKSMGQQLKGPVGIIVGFNAAVTATLLFAQAVEKSTKKLEEQGKKVAEFYSGIADDVSSAVAQIEDPLGSLAAEQQLISLQNSLDAFESIAGRTFQSLKEDFEDEGWYTGFSGVADVIRRTGASLGEFFNISEGEIIKNSAAVGELIKQIEGLEAQQVIRDQIIANSKVLSDLKTLLDETNKSFFDQTKSLTEVTAKGELYQEKIQDQIDAITSKAELDQNDIIALNALRDAYDAVTDVMDKQTSSLRSLTDAKNAAALADLQILALDEQRMTSSERRDLQIKQAEQNQEDAYRSAERAYQDGIKQLKRERVELNLSDDIFEQREIALRKAMTAQMDLADATEEHQKRQAELNKIASDAGVVQSLAQTTAVLGQIFGASKDMQIAMAVIDGGAAIVKTFAQLGFPAGIPAALAVAAQTAQTIKQMKSTNPGDATPIGAGGGGEAASSPSFGFQMSQVEGPQTFRTPGYTPMARSEAGVAATNVQILASRKQLYAVVKKGEEEYRNIKAT